MKEYLRQLPEQAPGDLARGCVVREYLQARTLESLQDAGVFLRWAFLGGTALRFLYSLPRFSEDLDFSLIALGESSGMGECMARVRQALEREGYRTEAKVNDGKTVASAFLKFPGLPYELGMSGHREQTLTQQVPSYASNRLPGIPALATPLPPQSTGSTFVAMSSAGTN